MTTEEKMREWVRGHMAGVLKVAPETIAFDKPISEYGLDSVDAILMAGELEQAFKLEIDPATFIRYETFDAAIQALSLQVDQAEARPASP
jgi:acyl carrier protein